MIISHGHILGVYPGGTVTGDVIKMNNNDMDYNNATSTGECRVRTNQTQDSNSRNNKSFKEYFREYAEKTRTSELLGSWTWFVYAIKYALCEKLKKQ